MRKSRLRRPSPALVLSCIALFMALGGGAYAATSSDSKQDKQIANKAAKTYFNHHIANASVSHANTAARATIATNATNAADATNADQLGGSSASAFHDRCPSGTTRAAHDLCVTKTNVGTSGSGENTWIGALKDCAALGLRLPSPAEAFLLVSTTSVNLGYWTDDYFQDSGTPLALIFTHDSNTPAGRLNNQYPTAAQPVRCVTTPTNS